MSWLRTLLLAFFAFAALCAADSAAAHASLVAETPADGAALSQAPREVVLEFDEPVAPMAMRLVDARGTSLTLPGAARAERSQVRVALPDIGQGAFVFSWRVASADAHPVAGSIAFTVGEGTQATHQASETAAGDSGLDGLAISARLVRDLLLLATCGAALFAALVGSFQHQRALIAGAGVAAMAGALAELGIRGATLAGQDASLAVAFHAGAASTAGRTALAACIGLGAIVIGSWIVHAGARKALWGLGAIVAAASVALTGHAAAAQPAWLGMLLVACHAVVAAFWFGSLFALLLLERKSVRAKPVEFAQALRRFSRRAMPAVALLAVAGVSFAAMQLESLRDLRTASYGHLVIAKALVLLVLLCLAACNRFVLTRRLEEGDTQARVWLRRTITGELALIVAVLAVTAVLSHTPPHAPSHTHAGITQELAGSATYHGSVTITPGRPGRNLVVVTLRDDSGRPLRVDEATLVMSHARSGIESIERPLIQSSEGTLRHEGAEMSFPGTWRLSVEARIGDFEQFTLGADVEIR